MRCVVRQLRRCADDIWNGFKAGVREPRFWLFASLAIGVADMIWIAASH